MSATVGAVSLTPPLPPVPALAEWTGACQVVRCDLPMVRQPSFLSSVTRHGDRSIEVSERGESLVVVHRPWIAWVRVSPQQRVERATPTWAIVLGILLLFTLVGIALFFVKENRVHQDAVVEVALTDGRMVALLFRDQPSGQLQSVFS